MLLPRRLRRLPAASLAAPLDGLDIRRARDPLARLIGLAGLRELPRDAGLLLPGPARSTRSGCASRSTSCGSTARGGSCASIAP